MADNGLRTFAFHTQDEGSAETVAALRAERLSLAAFAILQAVGLSNLDPETTVRQDLLQALTNEVLPQLTVLVG